MNKDSMTVGELIAELEKCPKDAIVYHKDATRHYKNNGEPLEVYFDVTCISNKDGIVIIY